MEYSRAYIKDEITSFRNRMRVPSNKELSVGNNDDVLKYAVYQAYRDMQPRTIKGHKMPATKELRDEMVVRFVEYFKYSCPGSATKFDEKHKELCKDFLVELNKVVPPQEFGKAQKFVNMTFKYLYCFDNAKSYEDYFKYCHMPIDSYTLNWCFDRNLYQKNQIKNWSCIVENQYYDLSGKIIKAISKEFGADETPLLIEFKIWPQEIAKVEEKELIKAIMDYIANNYDSYCVGKAFNRFQLEQKEIDSVLKKKIQKLNIDRNLDGLDKLDGKKLCEILQALNGGSLFSKIEAAIKNM